MAASSTAANSGFALKRNEDVIFSPSQDFWTSNKKIFSITEQMPSPNCLRLTSAGSQALRFFIFLSKKRKTLIATEK